MITQPITGSALRNPSLARYATQLTAARSNDLHRLAEHTWVHGIDDSDIGAVDPSHRTRPGPVPLLQGLQAPAYEILAPDPAAVAQGHRMFRSSGSQRPGVATATRQQWLKAIGCFGSVCDPRVAAFAGSRPGVRTAVGTRVSERSAGHPSVSCYCPSASLCPSRQRQ